LQAEGALQNGQILVLQKEANNVRVLVDCSFPGGLRPQSGPWSETTEISTRLQVDASLMGNATLLNNARARVEQGESLLLRLVGVSSYVASVAGGKAIPWSTLRTSAEYGCDGATHLVAISHIGAAQLRTARQQGGAVSVGPVALGGAGAHVFDERIGEPDHCGAGLPQGPGCQRLIAMDLIPIAQTPSSKVNREACDERNEQDCLQRCHAGNGESCNNVGYVLESGSPSTPQEQRLHFALGYYQQACKLGSAKGCANEQRIFLFLARDDSQRKFHTNKLAMYCEQNIAFACEAEASEKLERGEKSISTGAKGGVMMDPVGALSAVTGTASNVQDGLRLLQRACALGSREACYKLRQQAARPMRKP
jgi:TPR repeat protein